MNNRLRWILWGILCAALVAAATLIVLFQIDRPLDIPRDAIFVPRDVGSLAEALAQVTADGAIVIEASAGPIQGPVVLDVPGMTLMSSGERVQIHGIGADPAVSIVADGVRFQGFDITSDSVGLRVGAADCMIEDIHVNSSPFAISLDHAPRCTMRLIETQGGRIGVDWNASGSVVLEDSTIADASEFGVRLRGSWQGSLRNLTLSGNAVGISIEKASEGNILDAIRIDLCTIAGIEIRGSNGNTVANTTIASARIGIILEGVTGTEIRSCDLEQPHVTGIHLQQAQQNRILETRVSNSQGMGIQLTQSPENALLYNVMIDCEDGAISLISSTKNLIMGNDIQRCFTGITVKRSDHSRILRNSALNTTLAGFIVLQGKSNQLLDNVAVGSPFGMVLADTSDNTILRNELCDADSAGLLMIQTSGENYVAENEIHDNVHGLILAAVRRDAITQNDIRANEIGIWIASLGAGVRIEGNTIARNRSGFVKSSDLAGLENQLEPMGIASLQPGEEVVPVLASNRFIDNQEFDIRNQTMISLPAAGNWWGQGDSRDVGDAAVSDGVLLEQSAWRGILAVGTGSNDVSILLGRILELTLIEAGFRVIDLVGMGPSLRVQQALADADVDLIWWSGATLGAPLPSEETAQTAISSSAVEGWRMIVSPQLADQLATPTISGLAARIAETGESLRYAALASFGEEESDAFLAAYGLEHSVRSFSRAQALEEVEALLKFGAVDVAIVGNLEETLTIAGFLAIADDLQVLNQNLLSIVIQKTVSSNYSELQETLASLGGRLTSDALHDLVSRIRLLHLEPSDVAREFVQQQ